MALIKCPQCGQTISDKASRCPKCGCVLNSVASSIEDAPISPNRPNGGRGEWLIILLVVVALGAIGAGGYLYMSHQKEMAAQDKAAADSIAALTARVDSLRQDSIRKDSIRQDSIFVATFVQIFDIIALNDYGDAEFKRDVSNLLSQKGYKRVKSEKGTREGEGGENCSYSIDTYESSKRSDLWSRVIIDDGFCGGFTIEFCNQQQKKKFIDECKELGYRNDEGSDIWIVGDTDWGTGKCEMNVFNSKVFISTGCI